MLKLLIFGTGKGAGNMLESLDSSIYSILAYIDNNKSKQGGSFADKCIISPLDIQNYEYDKIIICSTSYKEIKKQLEEEFHIPDSKIATPSYFAECEFLNYYGNLKKNNRLNNEEVEILDYIQRYGLEVFNYPFSHKYDNISVNVMKDKTCDLYYVIHKGMKVYFKRGYSISEIADFYKSIIKEQDEDSPHKYLVDGFQVEKDNVVIDAGTAEGIFSLEIIDKVKKLYMIETDLDWIEALQYTFSPWKNKVIFINKFLTDFSDGEHITIDDLVQSEKIDFIKMDVEGSECRALQGAKRTIDNTKHLKVDMCAYHNNDDAQKIRSLLIQYGFKVSESKGFMVFTYNKSQPYRLVRGLVRGEK